MAAWSMFDVALRSSNQACSAFLAAMMVLSIRPEWQESTSNFRGSALQLGLGAIGASCLSARPLTW